MTELGWTSEALLNEVAQLLEQYDLAETQKVKDQINGRFVAIQGVLIARSVTAVNWSAPPELSKLYLFLNGHKGDV